MQYHACTGPQPQRIGTGTIEGIDWGTGGMMSDLMMYGDYKKLLRKDTLTIFRERFLESLLDLDQRTPVESGNSGLAIDAIMGIFDDVAKGINYNSDL
jgi:hypothetical protein